MTLKQRLGAWLIPRLPVTRFLFDQIRVEIGAWRTGATNRLLPSRRRRLARLRRERGLLVNVACGPLALPGFVNLDLYATHPDVLRWDCRRRLPFADGAVAGLRAEQFFEHLETRQEVPAFLAECRRVLAPGAVLRIIVPDAGRFLAAYCLSLGGDLSGFRELAVPEPFPADLPTRMDVVNHAFHQWHEHRWGYDFETLAHRLHTAGFRYVEQTTYRRSLDPRLAGDEEHPADAAVHAPYSLYADAVQEP